MNHYSGQADAARMPLANLSNNDIESTYARWAPVYDRVFARILRPGRQAAADAVNRHGGRTLNVGVGTGLELPMFAADVPIVGVDLSEPMLEAARQRVTAEKLTNVENLQVMDALDLKFPDGSFDIAVAPYVVTTVPDPHRALDEMARVVRPGGEIVIVNHVSAESSPIAWTEALLARFSDKLGWSPIFPWSIFAGWIDGRDDVALSERRVLPPLGLFNLIRIARK